ncbi:LOW QUALITY PROTEIN: adenylate cyclase type 9 [Gymnodraco acuticeps]|uniref:adenylate cyclase n=1 Tax=Gymnodraco acuticeps TaxID=8218 RepID=A0A6P8W7T9_GYMAC|nr:LOW QUALITY PROTEIN: adenylate cyclase type 9 [Gymnodraco acuticeps]
MATLQHHRQLPRHGTEVSCDSSGDGAVTVRISNSAPHVHQHGPLKAASSGAGGGGAGGHGAVSKMNPNSHKYSISSSCSSADSRPAGTSTAREQRKAPPLFERSAAQCWDPKFDSPILEDACQERCFPQTQRRFRYVLFYLAVAAVLWGIYFGVNSDRCHPMTFLAPTAAFFVVLVILFLFTLTQPYTWLYNQTSLFLIAVTFAITLAPQVQTAGYTELDGAGRGNSSHPSPDRALPTPCISPVGTFSLCMEVLLLLYSVLHVRLYASVILGLLYSILFEALEWLPLLQRSYDSTGWGTVLEGSGSDTLRWLGPAKALLHLCAHVIGIHLFIMSEVRSRSTFLKVGQAIMHGKDLEVEKALKERMIHSVMPQQVADELMKQGDDEGGGENSGKRYSSGACSASAVSVGGGGGGGASQAQSATSTKNYAYNNHKRKKTSIPRGQIIFRPFNMKRMEPVSILFADIVGFTRMSANKSAPALVGLLNDLFGRFDRLCELTCCEKISTLGDCYYCVAGCPEPRPDHANCCVEMGLGMIQAIEQFCQETCETVNMRVGVHTGTVLCGILGMKRFKFDVWSNDVNLANLMEQLGVAGKVHLSEATVRFLGDHYQREDGRVAERAGESVVEKLKGLKTYLISGRKVELDAQCVCPQVGLSGGEMGGVGLSSCPQPGTPDLIPGGPQAAEPPLRHQPLDRIRPPCVSRSVTLSPGAEQGEDVAVLNGCQEEHKSSSAKFTPGQSPRAANGLLSPPPLEDPVRASQSSLCDMLQEKEKKTSTSTGTGTSLGMAGGGGAAGTGMEHSALIQLRAKNFREKSDVHFVDVIREDSLMKDYFFKPPINKISLNFLERPLEKAYRSSYKEEVKDQVQMQTFASSTFSSFLDVLLSCFFFLALTLACFLPPLVSPKNVGPPAPAALAVAPLAGLLELASLVLSIRMAFYLEEVMSCTRSLLLVVSGWVPRHVIGAVLVSLPAISVLSHLSCSVHLPLQVTMFLCCATILAIIQYCNFCQLSFWMRSVLATVTGVTLLLLLYCPAHSGGNNSSPVHGLNISSSTVGTPGPAPPRQPLDLLVPEAVLAFFLLLLLVWFLNREFEVSYRLHYHGNVEADKHRFKIQTMRDQAEWLLGNIIPIHVADQLKVTQSYSKNHDSVGVIFASIVNFSEFYEESYEGGKECYRVLNELIGDFDELLRKPEFKSVEKIKTIGATYMAASGLNVRELAENDNESIHAHLRELFNFALEMMGVLDDFNKNMLGFGFKLRIGLNHGPLTAGVIGTTKLLYDIWGDTVNIASRMDSTGVECRVQVSEESHTVLSAMCLDFDYRGTVNVKGKGQMRTFLYPKSGENINQDHIDLGDGPSSVAPTANKTSGSVAQAAALPPSSFNPPSSSLSTLPPQPQRPSTAGPEYEPTEEREEGYRDPPHLPGQPPATDRPLPPHSSWVQPAPLAIQEEEDEEMEANELTKLNEEFYARL